MTKEEAASIRGDFLGDWESFLKVRPFKRVYLNAGNLAEEHALRGFDAIHLASFLEVSDQAAGETVEFSAFDSRLNEAVAKVAAGSR